MDWKFYGLREDPFGLTPDNRYLYLGEPQQEVLATLRESIEGNRGFVAVVSPPGIGKTTLLFQLIEDLRNVAVTAFVFQTTFQPLDILRLLWKELGLESEQADLVKMHQQFADGLARVAAMGKQFVLIVDEAQNLSPEALETIRLLANFESQRRKMVQIVFAGHPELETILSRPGVEHIRQRIAAFCRLKPLTLDQTRSYLAHRLQVAGHTGSPIFTDDAVAELSDLSKGIPRTINIYAFQAMSKASKANALVIDAAIVRKAVHQFEGWDEAATALAPVMDLTASEPVPEPAAFAPSPEEELKKLLANVRSDLERAGLQPAISSAPLTLEPAPARDRAAAAAASAPAPALISSDGTSAQALRPESRENATDKIAIMPGKPRVVAPPLASEGKAAKPRVLVLVAMLVVALGALGAFAWLRLRTVPAPIAVNHIPVPVVAASVPPMQTSAANLTAPITTSISTHPPAAGAVAPKTAADGPVAVPPTPKKAAPEAREIASDVAPASQATASTAPPKVSLTLGTTAAPNLGNALSASEAAPVEHKAVLQSPKPMEQPAPSYPLAARQRGIQGIVVLRVKVNALGEPTEVKIVSGNPILAGAAQSTVRSAWRFYPATSDGAPIAGETEVKINFHQ